MSALLQYNMVQHRVSIHRRSSVVRLTTIKIPIKLEWEDEVRYRYKKKLTNFYDELYKCNDVIETSKILYNNLSANSGK